MNLKIDEDSFRDIFNKYYDRIYSGFYKKKNSHENAQDLSQQTFIKFWRYRQNFTSILPVDVQLFRKGKGYLCWLLPSGLAIYRSKRSISLMDSFH